MMSVKRFRTRASAAVITVGAVLLALSGCTPAEPSGADQTAVAAGASAERSDAARGAFYSFGHTSASIPMPAGEPAVLEQRLPFTMTAEAERFRVVVRNVDYLADEPSAEITVQSVYLGEDAGDGLFAGDAPRLAPKTALGAGEALTTSWFDAETLALHRGEDYLLGVSFSAAEGAPVGVNGGVGWIRTGAPNGSMADAGNVGEFAPAGTFLDVSIEFDFADAADDVPVVAVFGHSLNAGANANPERPHLGEFSAWHQVWAREHGGVAASFAAPGAWTPNFTPDSPKWELADAVDADAVAIWASSSDLVSGTDLDTVGSYWSALIDRAHQAWPGAKIIAFTEPPRGATGEGEELRTQWNAFLRSLPPQIDALVDADELLKDPEKPSSLSPLYDGDGSHFTPDGHVVIAGAFAEALASAGR